MMLWTSANAWGLKTTGGLAEALLNLHIIHDAPKQVGGRTGMILAWAWNIMRQGVYDDEGNFPQDKEAFIGELSEALVQKRDRLSEVVDAKPEKAVYLPASYLYQHIGQQQIAHLASGLADLSSIDFVRQNAIYLTDGAALDVARQADVTIAPL